VLRFPADEVPSDKGCPIDCDERNLKATLATSGQDFKKFVELNCGGNFRDRGYKESGLGTKRSGKNILTSAEKGVLTFEGSLGGESSGYESASGAGDSGGPLFVFRNGEWLIAGVTHGGNLIKKDGRPMKRSIYVDIIDPQNSAWLREAAN